MTPEEFAKHRQELHDYRNKVWSDAIAAYYKDHPPTHEPEECEFVAGRCGELQIKGKTVLRDNIDCFQGPPYFKVYRPLLP